MVAKLGDYNERKGASFGFLGAKSGTRAWRRLVCISGNENMRWTRNREQCQSDAGIPLRSARLNS